MQYCLNKLFHEAVETPDIIFKYEER